MSNEQGFRLRPSVPMLVTVIFASAIPICFNMPPNPAHFQYTHGSLLPGTTQKVTRHQGWPLAYATWTYQLEKNPQTGEISAQEITAGQQWETWKIFADILAAMLLMLVVAIVTEWFRRRSKMALR